MIIPMADVSALRNKIGTTILGMVSTLFMALVSWGGVQLWASKLSVDDYRDYIAKAALVHQVDSIHFARLDRQIACATKSPRCAGRRHATP
jgi:hypothetical protein